MMNLKVGVNLWVGESYNEVLERLLNEQDASTFDDGFGRWSEHDERDVTLMKSGESDDASVQEREELEKSVERARERFEEYDRDELFNTRDELITKHVESEGVWAELQALEDEITSRQMAGWPSESDSKTDSPSENG